MDGLGDGEGEPAAVGSHAEARKWEGEGAKLEVIEGKDGGERDADEPHAGESDPEGADGISGTLHGADEDHGVAKEDFGGADVAQVLGGECGEFGLVGEDSAADGVSKDKEDNGDNSANDSGLVGGHPAKGRGAVRLFHAERLTDKGRGGDSKAKARHEGEGFDAESGADSSDCDFAIWNPFEDGKECKE